MSRLGDRIRELRDRAKLSQQQLADLAGIHVHSLRSYEAGRRGTQLFPLGMAIKIADALGINVDEAFASCVRPERKPGRK